MNQPPPASVCSIGLPGISCAPGVRRGSSGVRSASASGAASGAASVACSGAASGACSGASSGAGSVATSVAGGGGAGCWSTELGTWGA
ncbi:hypothetical protein EUA93_08470 [Nocardioides oleivorans]|uniref:Uncharacterized protein n=1 Tax=Nocardioides oleivorans TaxID=273676 RepID=A0A4Q2S1Z5_9ACTN|nr:hypothetical protein EUA93_08470 [Nocardioides oleivorans]